MMQSRFMEIAKDWRTRAHSYSDIFELTHSFLCFGFDMKKQDPSCLDYVESKEEQKMMSKALIDAGLLPFPYSKKAYAEMMEDLSYQAIRIRLKNFLNKMDNFTPELEEELERHFFEALRCAITHFEIEEATDEEKGEKYLSLKFRDRIAKTLYNARSVMVDVNEIFFKGYKKQQVGEK